jgi:hypothetical protein
MKPDTFAVLLEQLKDIDFDIAQTSGNGEVFLNPHYQGYIEQLKAAFPDKPLWLYNNFSLLDKERADWMLHGGYFERVHVTIDSLQPGIYERAKNLNINTMIENVLYFLSRNQDTPLTILYNDVRRYYAHCQAVTGNRPTRDFFTDELLATVEDEFEAIRDFFTRHAKGPVQFCRVNPCLWGERENTPPNLEAPCPKINVIEQVCWVLPNGNITVCCYDDNQDAFTVGNIHNAHIWDIWNGEHRQEIIAGIKERRYNGNYPCTNPACCSFGTGIEVK